jgi:hypothetical protein
LRVARIESKTSKLNELESCTIGSKNENLDTNPVSCCMISNTLDSEHLTAARKWREDLLRYLELFADAFDELHNAVIKQVDVPGQYIRPHHDYPVMSLLDSGFPSFHESGFHLDSAPRNYVSTMRPRGLLGILGDTPLSRLSQRALNSHRSCEVMTSAKGWISVRPGTDPSTT